MMDPDGDIAGAKARMPAQPLPNITREVIDSHRDRVQGFRTKKTFTVPPILKACAEDRLVKKEYVEMRCEIPGLTKSTFLMVFSPDGTKMASTHGNHNVYVTDLRTGKNIKTLVGHPRTPWCVAFHPSSNQILASGCLGGQVRIWDLSGGSEVWTAESQTVISSLAFHPVDRLLVIATYNELYFWDWSQPKPFMQTCTSNAKEKVRYVAFDRLGHKLITGIANTPQGFTRWERVRAPVPVARHSDRIAAYRRRITSRLLPTNAQQVVNPSPNPPETSPVQNNNSIPERERRIAVCYRNLVEQYEMLVHRYLEVYRPATTIDRGTDPMEAEHLANTPPIPPATEAQLPPPVQIAPTQSTPTSPPQTELAETQSTSTVPTTVTPLPGPSGLGRPTSRPNKRSNVPGTKSDSSTVYQSDSSSSSSSDESPTPKRRISLVPNANMFRMKSETNVPKNVKDSSTCTRKKLFMSRPSAFHLARSSNQSQNQSPGNSSSANRRVYERHLSPRVMLGRLPERVIEPIDVPDRVLSLMNPSSVTRSGRVSDPRPVGVRRLQDDLPDHIPDRLNDRLDSLADRLDHLLDQLPVRITDQLDHLPVRIPGRLDQLPVRVPDRLNRSPDLPDRLTDNLTDRLPEMRLPVVPSLSARLADTTILPSAPPLDDLRFPLSRLRGISEGSLSSADEVINFSERPMVNREEPEEIDATLSTDLPVEGDFPNSVTSIDNIYSHILSDLETSLREARNSTRPDVNRNTEPSNRLSNFTDRLENIMNQSDAILANLRRSMETLMEPNTSTTPNPPPAPSIVPPPLPSTSNASNSNDNSGRRIFILRKPSGFHSHNRQCSRGTGQGSSNNQVPPNSNVQMRCNRYFRIRQPRLNFRPHGNSITGVWRPFDDHSYPRDPEQGNADSRQSNVEPIRSLLTLSPRSPSTGTPEENQDETLALIEEQHRLGAQLIRTAMSATTVPAERTPLFPTADHNYPLPDPPPSTSETTDDLSQLNNLSDPIADHTYPRDPQHTATTSPEYIAPLVSSLHSTISHISLQTNLLRRQVESIEMIDRARFEVFQLQELRRMWEEVRRHLNLVETNTSERRSNMSNVRQMMAWTRISDPSPSSESPPQSSTEPSTSEPRPSVPDRPTPSTSRSSASSSNESRPQPYMNRFRHIKKRMYWRRRSMKNDNPYLNPRRYLRGHSFRESMSRAARTDLPTGRPDHLNLSEVTVSLMIRALENLLTQQSRLLGRRDTTNTPDRNSMEYRVQSERVIQSRIRAARIRLNRVNGQTQNGTSLEDPVECSFLGSRNDCVRYETRLRLSVYIETLTRFVEHHTNITPLLAEQLKTMLELALLITDVTLLQIMDSIPSLSATIFDPERESLSLRITQMCSTMLQNPSTLRSASLIRVLNDVRVSARCNPNFLRLLQRRNNDRQADASTSRVSPRDAAIDLNRQLRRLYQFNNFLNDSESLPPPTLPVPPAEPNPSTSTDNSMAHIYRLGDLLARLRSVRGRLEQVSQNATSARTQPLNSSSTTDAEPTTRSTDESPSDRESEPFEGFQTQWDQPLPDSQGNLYRTQHINLYPPEPVSSGTFPVTSYSDRLPHTTGLGGIGRPWNVPTVQVNDVPVSEMMPSQPRIWLHRYPSELRPLSAATGLFRPRFLIPLYAGINPFEADLDDPQQREGPVGYDGIISTTVSPNHRIQMWDISKCNIPNISNHEKNIVVSECKIHNDGSVDISSDGTLLVTLLPSGGYLNVTNRLGIYSIKWDTLGQCLYTTSFEQNAISVSLSPLNRHLIVGLASRRVTLLPSDRWTMARIFLLDDRSVKLMGRGRLAVLRDLEQGRERDMNFVSVNCIKWMPVSGQGIVYATNTGQLKVLT